MSILLRGFKGYLLVCGLAFQLVIAFIGYRVWVELSSRSTTLPDALNITAAVFEKNGAFYRPVARLLENVADTIDGSPEQFIPGDNLDMASARLVARASGLKDVGVREVEVSSEDEIRQALVNAEPGDEIVIAPGTYRFDGGGLKVSPGFPSAERPVIVRPKEPGSVRIELDVVEGIKISRPHWHIKGLIFEGKCRLESKCEHALHVVGEARRVVVENNRFTNFNAAIKVNSTNNKFPDEGRIEGNTFTATFARYTRNPISPINIDHANGWVVRNNVIRDFVKLAGNKVSYGAFIKGGAIGGLIENNLVMCNTSGKEYNTTVVGISVGGGGMKKEDRRLESDYEANGVVVRNNVIMNCSDVGIYVNKGKNSLVNNNVLYNTKGISLHYKQSNTKVINNFFSGTIWTREDAVLEVDDGNVILPRGFWSNSEPLDSWFTEPSNVLFDYIKSPSPLYEGAAPYPSMPYPPTTDYCGEPITSLSRFVGSFKPDADCFSDIGEMFSPE